MLSGCPTLGLNRLSRYKTSGQVGSSEAIFEGQFKSGFKEGFGVLIATSGYRYEGHFENNIMRGPGTTSLFSRLFTGNLNLGRHESEFCNNAVQRMHVYHEYEVHQVSSLFQRAMSSPRCLPSLKVCSRGGRTERASTLFAMALRHDSTARQRFLFSLVRS